MPKHMLAVGKRQLLGLELVIFRRKEFEKNGVAFTLWKCEGTPFVHINSIMRILDEFYGKIRMEHLDEILGTEKEVIIHIFREDGILAIEDYNKGTLTIQIKTKDKKRLLNQIAAHDWNVMGPLYKIAGITELIR